MQNTALVIEVGARLRQVRRGHGLTLAEVEAGSGGRWRASTVGAYERGIRKPSLPILSDLAQLYQVPISSLVGAEAPRDSAAPKWRVVIDLTTPEAAQLERPVLRVLRHVASMRDDFDARALNLRQADVETLAAALGTDVVSFVDHLRERGVLSVARPAGEPVFVGSNRPRGGELTCSTDTTDRPTIQTNDSGATPSTTTRSPIWNRSRSSSRPSHAGTRANIAADQAGEGELVAPIVETPSSEDPPDPMSQAREDAAAMLEEAEDAVRDLLAGAQAAANAAGQAAHPPPEAAVPTDAGQLLTFSRGLTNELRLLLHASELALEASRANSVPVVPDRATQVDTALHAAIAAAERSQSIAQVAIDTARATAEDLVAAAGLEATTMVTAARCTNDEERAALVRELATRREEADAAFHQRSEHLIAAARGAALGLFEDAAEMARARVMIDEATVAERRSRLESMVDDGRRSLIAAGSSTAGLRLVDDAADPQDDEGAAQ